MKKIIQKPVNWQDFESLCKKLFGEIWKCNNIKKNGRSGQKQCGVDIYGIPIGEVNYYGIQCKGKDDYINSKLTKEEIDQEILNAQEFRPPLKQFIFATTANKDSSVEEYIREINIKFLTDGKFSIDIFSWEDIVDLIEENKDTYNWYVKEVNHKVKNNVEIIFENDSNILEILPQFKRNIITFDKDYFDIKKNILSSFNPSDYLINYHRRKRNLSFSKICIIIYNSGSVALEEIKLELEFDNNFQKISSDNIEDDFNRLPIINYIWINGNIVTYNPHHSNRILIPKDRHSIELFLKPHPKEYVINMKWHLLSKDYDNEGTNIIKIKPKFKDFVISRKPNTDENDGDKKIIINDFTEII